jgi:hypothetical protein
MAEYSLVDECVDRFQVTEHRGGAASIHIEVPARFRDLWIVKLNELRTTDEEIKEYEPKLRLS